MSKKKDVKNPVPRIGRTSKEGYQFPQFKPSKKFEKQFPKAAKKREAAQKKHQAPVDTRDYFERLKDLGEQVRRGEIKIRKAGLPDGDLIDEITVLSNLYGIDEASEILDVDVNSIDDLLSGFKLNRLQQDEIEGGWLDVRRDKNLIQEYDIDIPYIDKQSAIIKAALDSIETVDNKNIFRKAVAEQDLDLDKIDEGRLLFKNLTNGQLGKILEAWSEQQQRIADTGIETDDAINLNDMFDSFFDDGADFWDIEESMFWAWFREIFYS